MAYGIFRKVTTLEFFQHHFAKSGHGDGLLMTRQLLSTFRQPPLHYLTRSVRRTSGFVLADNTPRKLSCAALVLAKCLCRVDGHDSCAGDGACDRRDGEQEDGRTCEGHRINRRNTEQETAGQFLRGPCAEESYGRTNRGHFKALLQY